MVNTIDRFLLAYQNVAHDTMNKTLAILFTG